jgi:hypothetical protein
LQKFDGAMAAWLTDPGDTQISALNYDQLLKTALLSRNEAVHAALRCLRFVACVGWRWRAFEVQRRVMRENHTRTISLQQPREPQFDHPRSQQFLP